MTDPATETAESPTDTVSAVIGSAVTRLRFEDLPAETIERARLCVLDYLASAFESVDLDWSKQAVRAATAAAGPSGIIGHHETAAPGEAAFANAVLGHGLVRDDMHLGSISHLGVVVIPPALAVAESTKASGPALITAIVAGYETGGKIGRAILDVDVSRIHRPTGITGPAAGAAAAGKLAGLADGELAAAIGIAANTVLGYNEWAATGGSEMFFHPGFAARNAITAVDLARAGAFVSPTALEGPAGLLAAFGKAWPAGAAQPFSTRLEILEVFFKEVPACNFAQTSAQAARSLAIEHDIPADSIREVRVRVPQAAAAYPGCDAPGPFERTLQAKMSIHYNVAAALLERSFDETNYLPSAQPAITALAATIMLETDPGLTALYPAQQGAEVSVRLKDGTRHTHRQDDVLPASEELVRERFATAATARLGASRAAQLGRMIESLESVDDVSNLIELCKPDPSAADRTGPFGHNDSATGGRAGTAAEAD